MNIGKEEGGNSTMKTNSKLYFILTLLGIVLYSLFLIFQPSQKEIICEELKAEWKREYKGEVKQVSVDSINHMNRIVILKSETATQLKLDFNGDRSGIFEYLEIGDYVHKDSLSFNILVSRNQEDRKFIFNFGINCDN